MPVPPATAPSARFSPLRVTLSYAAFAGLWIAASDRLLSLVVADPDLLERLNTFKGLVFVLVTTGLLYLLLQSARGAQPQAFPEAAGARLRRPMGKPFVLLLALVLALALATIGFGIVRLHAPQFERDAYAHLGAVAELRAHEIERWLAERQGNGEVLAADREFAATVLRWLRGGREAALGRRVRDRLEALRAVYRYGGVTVLDGGGRPVLALGEHWDLPERLRREVLPQAQAGRQVARSGFLRDETGRIRLAWVVPILHAAAGSSGIVATVVLHAAPERSLFPHLQSWPTSSPSAETVLVAREGDSVVLLNRLRHRPEAAFAHRLPLDTPGLPAAAAVLTERPQVMRGVDYRGVPVLAATRPVRGTPWHLVTKTDRDEVLAPLRHLLYWVGLVAFFALAVIGTALLLLWRQQQQALRLELRAEAGEALRASEIRYRTLTENLPGAVFRRTDDPEWTMVVLSDGIEGITGHPASDFIGNAVRSYASLILPDDRARVEAAVHEALAARRAVDIQYGLRCADGGRVWVHERSQGVFDEDGRLLCLDGFVWDISARKRDEERLRQAAVVFETTREGVILTDAQERILMVNRAFCELTGYTEDEVRGRTPRMLQSGHQDETFYAALWQSIDSAGHWQGELWNRRKSGELYPALLSVNAVRDEAGEITHYVGVFTDISRIKATEEKLEFLAHHDPLTGLPNRMLLFANLRHHLEVVRRRGTRLALLMLDLDRFKDVNDSFGHAAGDELLQQVAQRLSVRLRGGDMVSRLGGDEFTVLLDEIAHPEDAARVAEEIIATLAEAWQLSNGAEVRIGASVGITLFPDHGQSAETLLQQADAALYRAKAEGRGRFQFFSDDLTAAASRRIRLEARLRRAITARQLRLHYQAQAEVGSGRIVGAEALVRWQDPERGLIPPAQFIPVAEETGLIADIGAWVLEEACRQGAEWIEAGLPPLTLAVNLSPQQFRHCDVGLLVARVLAKTGFPADRLELELTESAFMAREEEAVETLQRLREQGVRLAIDDFGTGYSSLAYLKRFPLDVLKIDKRFVEDLHHGGDRGEIAAAIVAMGQALGFKVLGEGVENEGQLAFLQARGCNLYQGHLRSRPLPPQEFACLLGAVGERGRGMRAAPADPGLPPRH